MAAYYWRVHGRLMEVPLYLLIAAVCQLSACDIIMVGHLFLDWSFSH